MAGRAGSDAERVACRAWTKAYPSAASGWGCRGEVERREGRQELAAGFYKQAAEAGSEAYAGELMGLLLEQGSLAELMAIAAPVAARYRESIAVTVGFAQLQAEEAQRGPDSACDTLTALAGRIGGNVRRYADAVSRVRETARPELLRCFVAAALATRGRNEAMVLASAGAFDAAGLFDEARPLLERVIEIDPSNAVALNQLGYTLDGLPLGDMSYGNHNGLHISRAISSENLGNVTLSQGTGALGTASTNNLGGTLQFRSLDPSMEGGAKLAITGGSENTRRVFARLETGDLGDGLRGYVSFTDQKADKWKGVGEQAQKQLNLKALMPVGNGGQLTLLFTGSDRAEQDYQDLSF